MVIPSIVHITNLKSQTFEQNLGSANKFLDEYFSIKNLNTREDDNLNSSLNITTTTSSNTTNNNTNMNNNQKQICDKISNSRLKTSLNHTQNDIIKVQSLTNIDINNNKNANKIKIIKKENMIEEKITIKKLKKSTKKFKKTLHDPSINAQAITISTLKYGIIALITLILLGTFLFLFIIGVLYINSCGSDRNIPIYLIVMGIAGLTHIILYYSCPYDYSKSTLTKLYEHLIWRLVINRFKASYYSSLNYSSSIYESSNLNYSDLSLSSKCDVKFSCCSSFILNFFCCNCFCFNICKKCLKNSKNELFINSKSIDIPKISVSVYDVNEIKNSNTNSERAILSLNKSCNSITNSMNVSKNDSNSNISKETVTSNIPTSNSSLFDCFSFKKDKTEHLTPSMSSSSVTNSSNRSSLKKSFTTDSLNSLKRRFPRSKSTSELTSSSKRSQEKFKKIKRTSSFSEPYYGNRLFNGKYGHKYGTHKHIYRHHKKTHKPIRLFDIHSIRYGFAYLIQRCLNIFILIWFFCGNYWVFNMSFSELNNKNITNHLNDLDLGSINSISTSSFSVDHSKRVKRDLSIKMNNTIEKSEEMAQFYFCYSTAFYQIISFYSLFVLCAIITILYRFYLLVNQRETYAKRYK